MFSPTEVGPDALEDLRAVLSARIAAGLPETLHPGQVSWWMHHERPRFPDRLRFFRDESGFAVLMRMEQMEVIPCPLPGHSPLPMIDWATDFVGSPCEVGGVADDDDLQDLLSDRGYETVFSYRRFVWDLAGDLPTPALGDGYRFSTMAEHPTVEDRSAAARLAFKSSMEPEAHVARYRGFMASNAYIPERDLVVVGPDDTIAAFMIWWGETSGIAEIEPFGTHPDHHRSGLGRALMSEALHRMRDAGMRIAKVSTSHPSEASDFYEMVGFEPVGYLHWWAPKGAAE